MSTTKSYSIQIHMKRMKRGIACMLNNHFDKDTYPNYGSKVAFKPEFCN